MPGDPRDHTNPAGTYDEHVRYETDENGNETRITTYSKRSWDTKVTSDNRNNPPAD